MQKVCILTQNYIISARHIQQRLLKMILFHALSMLSLIHITTCAIYNVTPDDATCRHCHNLQHYLLKTTKYFTSNTQLHLLPGLHRLHTNLIIHNIHNVSLIGSSITNGTAPDTVIQCGLSVGIVMKNITVLIIKNIQFKKCSTKYHLLKPAIMISECVFVQLDFVYVQRNNNQPSLVGVNILGHSTLTKITCYALHLYYESSMTQLNNSILITQFSLIPNASDKYGLYVSMKQYSYAVTLHLSNITIHYLQRTYFLYVTTDKKANSSNKVIIKDCNFRNTIRKLKLIKLFYVMNIKTYMRDCEFSDNIGFKGVITAVNSLVLEINHCTFHSNQVSIFGRNDQGLITTRKVLDLFIKHCSFYNNSGEVLMVNAHNSDFISKKLFTDAIIQNVTISTSSFPPWPYNILNIFNTNLSLMGPVVFSKIDGFDGYIIELINSFITVYHYVEFSYNTVFNIVTYHCTMDKCFIMRLAGNAVINITNNTITTYFSADLRLPLVHKLYYSFCFFQYFLNNDVDSENCLVILSANKYRAPNNYFKSLIEDVVKHYMLHIYVDLISITHCYWLPQSAFNNTVDMPFDINRKFVHNIDNSKLRLTSEKTLCYCTNEKYYDCMKDDLGHVYPGQTIVLPLYAKLNFIFNADIIAEIRNQSHITSCIVSHPNEIIQRIGRNCTETYYTIAFPTDGWCELFLKAPQKNTMLYSIFYVRQLKCPLGFVKVNGTCQCYRMFSTFGFTKCDINSQAILRPPNGWIYLLHNKSHSYYISQQCPLFYCFPFSMYIHLKAPDVQCQVNRTGLLCGHCKHGLSTVLGSNKCQHCSNVYLLLLIAFAILGLLALLLLFHLNLTVMDGSIDGYSLYFNIIGCSSEVFFTNYFQNTPIYIITSFVNLNLGITVCFYNGMDDYAKVWLQLLFPSYLILLTISLIIASHYSTTVHRFTARRGLSVLSTLFVLSYTKILSTVSSVLFNFSSITHIPSKKTMYTWSLDANIPILGVKFIFLFIICLILFGMILLLNIMTLFSKVLVKYKCINKFQPLLDAYQSPYKAKFYYWIGLQLIIRSVFFGISSLNRNINLTVSIIILSVMNMLHGLCRPFKNKAKNYQELLLIINLLVLHTLVLSGLGTTSTIVTTMVALAIFQFMVTLTFHIIFYLCKGVVQRHKFECIKLFKRAVMEGKVASCN